MSHRRPPRLPSRRFRPNAFDRLEDRLALSHLAAHPAAAVHSRATTPTTRTTTPSQPDLGTQLAAADSQINSAYATFADVIRQAELAAFSATTSTATVNGTVVATLSTLNINPQTGTAVTAAVDMLGQSLAAALGSIPGAARGTGVIAAGLTGPGSGSLLGELTAIVAEAQDEAMISVGPPTNGPAFPPLGAVVTTTTTPVTTGYVRELPLAQLYSTVEGVMAASYNATAVETYLAALPASGQADADFLAVATPINAAYGALGTAVEQGEVSLPPILLPIVVVNDAETATPAGTTNGTAATSTASDASTTPASFQATLDAAATTAGAALNSALVGGAADAATALIQAQSTGTAPGSLLSQFDSAIATGSLGGDLGFFLDTYGLLDLALSSAIAASYDATSIEVYLAATA